MGDPNIKDPVSCDFPGVVAQAIPDLDVKTITEKLLLSAYDGLAANGRQVPIFFAFFEKTVEIFHIVDKAGNWRSELMPRAFIPYVAKRRPDVVAFMAEGLVQQLTGSMSRALDKGTISLEQVPTHKTLGIFIESRTEFTQMRYQLSPTSDGGAKIDCLISYESSSDVSPTKRPEFTFYDTLPARSVYH